MATKLYLGKTKDIIKEELKALVSRYGMVKSFEDKESYCFVDYFYESDARIAQVELDGQIINGCKLVAQFSKTSIKADDISKEALPTGAKRVYVGNLNYKFNNQEIHDLFSRFGPINELIHKDTYALIEFSSQQNATMAILHLNEKQIKGETLKVDMQKSYDEVICSTNRVYIGKLSPEIKKNDLVFHFGQFGYIEDVTLKEENFGFIQYRNILQASKAIKEMNGAVIKGCKIQVQEARNKITQNLGPYAMPYNQPITLLPHQTPYQPQKHQNTKNPNHSSHNNQNKVKLQFSHVAPQQSLQNIPSVFMPDLKLKSRSRSRSKEKQPQNSYQYQFH